REKSMLQIDVSLETLQRWYDDGVSRGAVAMTIMTDTFPVELEQYPEYEIPGEDREPREFMQMAGRRFSLEQPLADQMPRAPQRNFMGCYCRGPCGCG
ncbi:hypothetical protein N9L26_01665, partial [Candidatus Pacebacteria bacterium]|nr:hypothetical protein [Candidatus Paceibacterota bacterium]